jgi:hypothetical protein
MSSAVGVAAPRVSRITDGTRVVARLDAASSRAGSVDRADDGGALDVEDSDGPRGEDRFATSVVGVEGVDAAGASGTAGDVTGAGDHGRAIASQAIATAPAINPAMAIACPETACADADRAATAPAGATVVG